MNLQVVDVDDVEGSSAQGLGFRVLGLGFRV